MDTAISAPEVHSAGYLYCLRGTGRLRRGEFILRKKLVDHAGDLFLRGQSNDNQFRREQHTELDDHTSDEHFHRARNVHFHFGEWLDKRESDHDDHLYSDRNECRWLDHCDSHAHRERRGQTNHQFIHCESDEHHFRFQQRFELEHHRRDQHCDYSGDIHFQLCNWLDERESEPNDHIHTDRDEPCWLNHSDSKSDGHLGWQPFVDHNNDMPGRYARRGLFRMHHRRQRRHAPVQLFGQHQRQFSAIA